MPAEQTPRCAPQVNLRRLTDAVQPKAEEKFKEGHKEGFEKGKKQTADENQADKNTVQ